jgi:hypothetical protein
LVEASLTVTQTTRMGGVMGSVTGGN